jgi:hypothetical protein
MKRRRRTPEQVIRKVAEGDKLLGQGKDLEEVCRHISRSPSRPGTAGVASTVG